MDCAKFKLKEISYHITDGEHCSVQNSEDGGFYLLSNKNIIDGNIVFGEDERKISKETFDKINKRTKLSKGDLVISTVGTLGKLSIIKEIPNYDFQRSVGIIKPNCSVVDVEYLYYYMQQSHVQKKLTCGSSGAIQKCIFINQLKDFEVQLPSLSIQHRLASALSSFDKRIENLRAQNRVLEQTAKTIYDYTFLQCAGHQTTYNKTLNRNIPVSWEVKNIFDVFDIKYGFPFSTELFTEEITDKPVVRIRDILEHTTSAYTTEIVDEKYRLQEGDLVIGMDGNFHMNLWADNISYLNQRCVRIRMNGNNVTSIQAKFALAPYIKAKEMTAKGSTVGHLSDKDLKGMFILVPDSKTLKNFNAQVLPIFQKQLVNTKQIEALTTQRNTLLPLFMTGQITIK